MEWKCVRRLPAQHPLQVQLLLVTMVAEFLAMGNGNAYDQLPPASWDQLLALCFGKGGFLQWGMENVVTHLRPRSGGRWQGPAFTGVFGGQCPNGGDNGGRKDTDQPLFEGLMHNKTSSALCCMAKMPRFLKGA